MNKDTITFSRPEENTLGVVVGNARRAMTSTARRLGRAASTHRASLGTAFLGLGAAIIVGLRAVYGAIWFASQWGAYPQPLAALAAWIVLAAVLTGAIVMSRVSGDRLPDWMFGLFLAGIATAITLDVVAVWNLHDIGRYATAALTAGMALLVLVALRGSVEILTASAVLGVGLAVVIFLDAPLGAEASDSAWLSTQVTAIAGAVLPPIIGVIIIEGFRRMVQIELDRVLVQSTVSAPRFAVGMLASEELARLDLAAEELLDAVANKKTNLPLTPKNASVAAQLATELRLHLIEGRRETWLYHAISESEQLGKSVTLSDKSSLAGLLDATQRDGLLSAAWLLVADVPSAASRRRSTSRTLNIQIGPVLPGTPNVPEHKISIPVTMTSTGVPRNRVDSGVWDAIGRIGRYSDSTQDASLRVDIDCIVDNPADL
ncbi:MAG: hypothetical protein ABI435_02015 [Pseudolysinimonas sp.]